MEMKTRDSSDKRYFFIKHSSSYIRERRKRGDADKKYSLYSTFIIFSEQDTCNGIYRHTSTTSHYK